MAGTRQIRPPSPSYSDAVSLLSPLQGELDIVTDLDMSIRTESSFHHSSLERVDRHEEYYIPTGDVVFMVENTLFRVHQHFFVRESAHFRTVVFPSSNFKQAQVGTSDAHPIIRNDVTAVDFARLLWVFYNDDYTYDATIDVWSSILRVAHNWGFDKVKSLAIREMEKTTMSPVDKAVLARDCDVGNDWLATAYAELGARDAPLTKEEGQRLGLYSVIQLAEVREKIRDRRANPPPPPSPPIPEVPKSSGDYAYDSRVAYPLAPSPRPLFGQVLPQAPNAVFGFADKYEVESDSRPVSRAESKFSSDKAPSIPPSAYPSPKQVSGVLDYEPAPDVAANVSREYTYDDIAIVRSVFSLT